LKLFSYGKQSLEAVLILKEGFLFWHRPVFLKCLKGYLLACRGINLKGLLFFTPKNRTMKKLLFLLALGAFAACGSGENKTGAADSTTTDSAAAHADTAHRDSAVMLSPDRIDTAKKDTTQLKK
jgi:hypothetical protein